jgi:murein DD-endopeptidase MepM/ murein hydrolase activator NlpD
MLLTLTLCWLGATDAGLRPSIDDVALEVVGFFDEQRADALTPRLSGPLQKALPPERLAALMKSLEQSEGRSTRVDRAPGERSERSGTWVVTTARGSTWRLSLTVDGDGTLIGLSLSPPKKPDPPVVRGPPLPRLPFSGAWTVVWGGASLEVNQHVTVPSQRRAVDAIMVDDAGSSHRGDGTENGQYFAYGQPLFAVADGTVETIVDGVPDNVPGQMNTFFVPGNMVVLRHGDGLFSVYAHLIPGSAAIKVGQRVKAGAPVGRVGNSGNSSEAHLHFQLQDGPRFERSWGVEPVFTDVRGTRDGGTSVEPAYTWLKGDVVVGPPPVRR